MRSLFTDGGQPDANDESAASDEEASGMQEGESVEVETPAFALAR